MSRTELFRRPRLEREALGGYRHERVTELTTRAATAALEGGFVGVIADKIYQAPPLLLAVIVAAPMFGNLMSFLWARLATGRPKVPIVRWILIANALLVAAVGVLPEGPVGTWLLVAIVVASRLLVSGMITVRTNVWSTNYPPAVRARVTSRLAVIGTLTMTASSFGGSWLLDQDPQWFRWIYPVCAALSCIGVARFSRVTIIGEADQLSLERAPRPDGAPRDSGWSILRRDPLYARYQLWQFVIGTSNMMLEAPIVILVSQRLQADFMASIAATIVIPFGVSLLTMPLWAAYIDRVHIARFRARQGGLWVLSHGMLFVGAWYGSLAWVMAARFVLGLARGGGMLAWQIGHNDFAPRGSVATYMGIHVTLTGVRGAFAPFAGTLLYAGWAAVTLPGAGTLVPAFAGIDAWVFAVATGLSALSSIGFSRLDREIERRGIVSPEDAEAAS